MLQIVWFKKDLRTRDHAPLTLACHAAQQQPTGAVIALYLIEPQLWAAPDAAAQHYEFARECVAELKLALLALGIPLALRVSDAVAAFEQLRQQYGAFALHSHEETGNDLSFKRDIAVGAFMRTHGFAWHEQPSNGVVRRLSQQGARDNWSALWMARMQTPPLAKPQAVVNPALQVRCDEWPDAAALNVREADKPQRLRGGRKEGVQLLKSFLAGRGTRYRFLMSSPLSADTACSRLSPYLSFGCISVREVVHALWAARTKLKALEIPPQDGLLQSLASFESRLHWHCHFIQKLESAPRIEFSNVHSGFDGIRNEGDLAPEEQHRFDAWCAGTTGFPLIDACMRMLHATGWINFRMRAMLVSFASYHLWLHWRATSLYLARQFLDYEPGIHYPQFQMQSGVTGINTLRVYNPVKQARDQDPQGIFVKRWCPELARVPLPYIFEPHTMPQEVQALYGCKIGRDYPAPLVDNDSAMRTAKETLYGLRKQSAVADEARTVFKNHGSRNPRREGSGTAKLKPRHTAAEVDAASVQFSLFE